MLALARGSCRDALLIGALTLAVFSPTLANDWVEWDDLINFGDNPHYRGLGWSHVTWMFTTALMGHWTPLTWLTLGLDHVLWDMNPVGYHLTNLLWHAANAALVFVLAQQLLRRVWPDAAPATVRLGAATAALLFAVHPLRVESVAWVSERRDLVSGFFYLVTILAWLSMVQRTGASRRPWWIATLTAYAMALLSKSIVISLPLVLLVLDVYPLRRLAPATWRSPEGRRVLLEKVPFALMAAAVTALTLATFRAAQASVDDYPPTARLAMVGYSLAFYVRKTLLPANLSPLYELPWTVRLTDPEFLGSTIVVLAVLVALVVGRCRWPAGLAVAIAYALTVAPVSGLAHSGPQLVADRYSYLSTLGLAVLLGGGVIAVLSGAVGDLRASLGRLVVGSVAAWIAVLAFLTVDQIQVWRNDRTLWEHALAIDPACANCARAYAQYQARTGAAEARLRGALHARPADIETRTQLAALLVQQRRFPEAETELRAALHQAPDSPDALAFLGLVLVERGRAAEAVRVLERAIGLRPSGALAHFAMGRALQALGREADAQPHLEALMRVEPRLGERLKRRW